MAKKEQMPGKNVTAYAGILYRHELKKRKYTKRRTSPLDGDIARVALRLADSICPRCKHYGAAVEYQRRIFEPSDYPRILPYCEKKVVTQHWKMFDLDECTRFELFEGWGK